MDTVSVVEQQRVVGLASASEVKRKTDTSTDTRDAEVRRSEEGRRGKGIRTRRITNAGTASMSKDSAMSPWSSAST